MYSPQLSITEWPARLAWRPEKPSSESETTAYGKTGVSAGVERSETQSVGRSVEQRVGQRAASRMHPASEPGGKALTSRREVFRLDDLCAILLQVLDGRLAVGGRGRALKLDDN